MRDYYKTINHYHVDFSNLDLRARKNILSAIADEIETTPYEMVSDNQEQEIDELEKKISEGEDDLKRLRKLLSKLRGR